MGRLLILLRECLVVLLERMGTDSKEGIAWFVLPNVMMHDAANVITGV